MWLWRVQRDRRGGVIKRARRLALPRRLRLWRAVLPLNWQRRARRGDLRISGAFWGAGCFPSPIRHASDRQLKYGHCMVGSGTGDLRV